MNTQSINTKKNLIKFFFMDVDGTLTDGMIYMSAEGECMKAFNIKDGYGIKEILPAHQVKPIIITGRSSEIVKKRAMELNIHDIFLGVTDKKRLLDQFLQTKSNDDQCEYTYANCAYIGDDIPDLLCMSAIREGGGIAACPANAVREIKEISNFISQYPAGAGAVRDVIEYLASANG